jgi:nicotinate-nucleotide--dimethylbenzimidazole phosphoribosyltransferase
VPAELPADLAERLDRIVAPAERTAAVPADVTGELAGLLGWWLALVPEAPLVPAELRPAGAGTPSEQLRAGFEATDRAIDAGATLLVPGVDAADPEAARALYALLARKEASAVTYQAPGTTDRDWMTACAAVRDRSADLAGLRGDPVGLLDALPAGGIAFVTGALLAGAARRTPCLVDGTDSMAAALVADRMAFRAKGWWRAGADSPDPGRRAAAERIDLPAGLPLGLTDESGRGAAATVALLGLLVAGH